MGLSASKLKADMIRELESVGFDTSNQFSWANQFCTAISNAVVNHIKNEAKVMPSSI